MCVTSCNNVITHILSLVARICTVKNSEEKAKTSGEKSGKGGGPGK